MKEKIKVNLSSGFDFPTEAMNSNMFDFQRYVLAKALKAGRYAVFADCGLGKARVIIRRVVGAIRLRFMRETMIYKKNLFGKYLVGWKRKWIIIKVVAPSIADKIIQENHYSGKATSNRFLSMGIYHTDNPSTILGCLQLGYGIRPKMKHTWGDDVTPDNSVEFDRMWLSDSLPRFSETIVLSALARYLHSVYPQLKYILSYADGTVGNNGTIYKAGNYRFCGKLKADFYILESGERVHPVSMWHRHGSRAWGLMQELYPGIKKAVGYQYRFMYKLR